MSTIIISLWAGAGRAMWRRLPPEGQGARPTLRPTNSTRALCSGHGPLAWPTSRAKCPGGVFMYGRRLRSRAGPEGSSSNHLVAQKPAPGSTNRLREDHQAVGRASMGGNRSVGLFRTSRPFNSLPTSGGRPSDQARIKAGWGYRAFESRNPPTALYVEAPG